MLPAVAGAGGGGGGLHVRLGRDQLRLAPAGDAAAGGPTDPFRAGLPVADLRGQRGVHEGGGDVQSVHGKCVHGSPKRCDWRVELFGRVSAVGCLLHNRHGSCRAVLEHRLFTVGGHRNWVEMEWRWGGDGRVGADMRWRCGRDGLGMGWIWGRDGGALWR